MKNIVIKFVTPKDTSLLLTEDKKLRLDLPVGQIEFDVEIMDVGIYNMFTLKSKELDFDISEDLKSKIFDSLYLTCLEFPLNLLLKPEILTNFVPESSIKETSLKHNINLKADFIGIQSNSSDTIYIGSLPVTCKCESSIKSFEETLNRFINLEFKKNDRLIRSIELLNSSNYLTVINQPSRFILLITAIETLVDQPKISLQGIEFIDNVQNEIDNFNIVKEEKDSLKSGIGKLKSMSIGRAVKKLIKTLLDPNKKYNGYEPLEFFNKAYDLRSKFVHDGLTKTEFLDMKNSQLYDFTKDLIINYLKKICC